MSEESTDSLSGLTPSSIQVAVQHRDNQWKWQKSGRNAQVDEAAQTNLTHILVNAIALHCKLVDLQVTHSCIRMHAGARCLKMSHSLVQEFGEFMGIYSTNGIKL